MSGKKVRNKFKDFIWDYYLTNREIGKQNDEYNREHPQRGWSTDAKVYLAIIVFGVVGIIVKYFIM
ncbi:hypothetical protein [Aminipila sp.]|uniref:hypothetical protein n=1 Tax=Aminipila sp. TaxID=2060095 RepID=UPI00289D8C47|nr:hypothetical protein [Aminipila sp.]